MTLERRGAERSRLRRRRNEETPERADSRRSAQRERQQRRRYLETVEQTDARRAVDRSQFQRRRNAETTEQTDRRRTADRSRFQRRRRVQKSAMQIFEAALFIAAFDAFEALFDVQTYGLHDNYVDNLALLHFWLSHSRESRNSNNTAGSRGSAQHNYV